MASSDDVTLVAHGKGLTLQNASTQQELFSQISLGVVCKRWLQSLSLTG